MNKSADHLYQIHVHYKDDTTESPSVKLVSGRWGYDEHFFVVWSKAVRYVFPVSEIKMIKMVDDR